MFWNRTLKRWERHPQCTCGMDCCICRFLRPLDTESQPIAYPEMDALRARERHPQPKPEPRKRTKGRKHRQEQAVKGLVRAICVERDGYCVLNGGLYGACDGPSEWAHVGKKRRARTRGMAPEQRHTTDGSCMLCQVLHQLYDSVGDDSPIALAIAAYLRRVPAGDEVRA